MKIKNNSGVWLFQRKDGTFYRGIQTEKIQWGGKKYYRVMYSQNGKLRKKLCDTLAEAKETMINALEKNETEKPIGLMEALLKAYGTQ